MTNQQEKIQEFISTMMWKANAVDDGRDYNELWYDLCDLNMLLELEFKGQTISEQTLTSALQAL